MPNLDLSIIIVSWNVRELLRRCLESIQTSLARSNVSYETLVIDNASHDDTPAMLRADFPAVRVIETGANLGFAGGVNVGLQQAQGEWVLVLNPDTEMVDDALSVLLDFARSQENAVGVAPQLRYADGSIQSSRRRFPTIGTYFWESTVLERWFPQNRWAQRYRLMDRSDDEIQHVDWAVGAALLVRRRAIEQAGMLDTAFWMYSEELEWQQRLAQYGTIWYDPNAVIIHHEGKSSEQMPARKHITFQQSKLKYAARTHGAFVATLLHFFLLATYGYEWLVEAAKWLLGHKRELRRERMAVYGQVLKGLGVRKAEG